MAAPLEVVIGDVCAGLLHPNGEGSFFELDEAYLHLPSRPVLGQVFEDTPYRPHRTRQGVPSWFANLLPEGPLRKLIAARANVHERRSLFLLRLLGGDLPGAVILRSETGTEILDDGVEDSTVNDDTSMKFSLAGVQLKFSAVRRSRGLTIPVHGQGGDWIVKLPDQRFDAVPENEYAMLTLARSSGIQVPEAELVGVGDVGGLPGELASNSGERALAVRRFDRDDGSRVHIEDFAQVLGLAPWEKYGATNFDTIARVVAETCPDDDLDELLRRLVFMVAIGNYDAHAKNWSLIYPDGRTARLSPAYDLVAVSAYASHGSGLERRLALKLAGVDDPERVTEATFRRLADRAKFDEERAQSVVRAQVDAIQTAWPAVEHWLMQEAKTAALAKSIAARMGRLPLFAKQADAD